MVKSNAPLQIRLTEPVVFLRGPSTGLDFRGRPQAVRNDGQPAMLRGLLTLRLAKPTRIRTISIRLTGIARTEWPEGIGLRRMDTSEEDIIMSESITYFSSQNQSTSRSRSARRTASLGPGVSAGRWDLYDGEVEDGIDLYGVPEESGDMGDWIGVSWRGRDNMATPRSASALPGTHGGTSWHRDRFFRQPSLSDEADLSLADGMQVPAPLSLRDRGPSPAYTPTFRHHETESLRSSLRQSISPAASCEPGLTPITSAPPSRTGSISFSAEPEHYPPSLAVRSGLPSETLSEDVEWTPQPPSDPRDESAIAEEEADSIPINQASPILEVAGHREVMGEVRFAQTIRRGFDTDASDQPLSSPEAAHPTNRAASIRTMKSAFSESSTSLTLPSQEHIGGENHPVPASIQTSTFAAHDSPVLSTNPFIRAGTSSENHRRASMSSLSTSGDLPHDPNHSMVTLPSSSRRSSLLSRDPARSSNGEVASLSSKFRASTSHSPEMREGRSSLGSASTIVNNDGPTSDPSNMRHFGTDPDRRDTGDSARSANGTYSRGSQRHGGGSAEASLEPSVDARGRTVARFSLSAALRGLSKGRISSKSRSRADRSRTSSMTEPPPPLPSKSAAMGRSGSGAAIPSRLLDERRTGRQRRADSVGATGEFVGPFWTGGADRRKSSETRTDSPPRHLEETSESQGRGRKKGMKLLTGTLRLSADNEQNEDDVHNWKEFRKGTYNYPISFPIPVSAPPTIHAEFGSVTYRLKATVVRVGTLTPNLAEDLEVSMIASPQEDDLEESENVTVERQWEDQMRYQIVLSGKAFPIGGTIPISIHLMPLTKCKIHRLTILLEEKSDYFAQNRKIARHDTPKKFLMLFVKQQEKLERVQPLLPIISDDVNAARDSPLAPLALQAALNNPTVESFDVEGHDDNMYATMLEPLGPWHLEKDLKLPDCASAIKFTTKHQKTNVNIAHFLKVTIRAERGDDLAMDARGRRKHFDIIIDTPIKILDCRVNPQWNSLPTYTAVNSGSAASTGTVCSIHGSKHAFPLLSSHRPSHSVVDPLTGTWTPPRHNLALPHVDIRESSVSRSRDRRPSEALPPVQAEGHEDSLLERNIVYDRLVSGQVTVTGEVPPSYGDAVASASAARAKSASRAGGGMERDQRDQSESRSRSRLGHPVVA